MKPFLLTTILLILLLVVLASWMHFTTTNDPQTVATQVNFAPIGISTNGTPPIASTFSPALYRDFNMAVEGLVTSDTINELEHVAGPSYQVTSVDFLQESPPVLRVKTRCECAENGPCCNYTRTFVVTILALREIYDHPAFQTPDTAGEIGVLEVWCYDHTSLTRRVSVPWAEVKKFLDGDIDGFQLWAMVTSEP